MARITGTKLMFNEDDVRYTPDPALPRLIRIIFLGLGITNEGYLARYHHYFREINEPNRTQKEHSQKAAADRKFLLDPRKLTFNMARNVLRAMGWEVVAVSFKLQNRLTLEEKTFSTEDTADELMQQLQKSQEVGVEWIE